MPPRRGCATLWLPLSSFQVIDSDIVTGALVEAAGIGPFFTMATAPAADAGPAWTPAADLYRDVDQVRELIETTAGRLGTGEARVAASIYHLGFAARLWSPVLGCAVGRGIVPDCTPLHLQTGVAGPVPLWLARVGGWRCDDPAGLATLVYREIVGGHLEPLTAAVRQVVPVAEPLLWGNVASALIGTLQAVARARPDLVPTARDLAERLLGAGRLRGTGRLDGSALEFLRSSCCLYYRVPGGGICGDCPIDPPGRRSPVR